MYMCSDLVKDAPAEVVGDDGEAVLGALQLVVEGLVEVTTLLLRLDDVDDLPAPHRRTEVDNEVNYAHIYLFVIQHIIYMYN